MSLVGDALRKARESGAPGRPPGAVVPGSLVLPPRRRRTGIGPVPLLLVALAAGLGGAAGVWWATRQRPSAQPAPTPAPPAAAPVAATPAPTEVPATAAVPPPAVAAQEGPAAAPAAPVPALPAAVATTGGAEPAPPVGDAGGQAGGRRLHVALIDADLGYARLHLDYLVYRPGSPFGRVNGRDVVIGSQVDGFTVEEITADHIKLADRRNVVVLRVR